MYKNKVISAIILARKDSSRLKDKVLLPFGKSIVIESVIERIKHSDLVDSLVLATSTNPNDDAFKEIAARNKIILFRGSEDDVVSRMWLAANELLPLPDIIVRVCSDNPLLMPSIIDKAIVELVDSNVDVITPAEFNTYPFGYSMVVMTRECLERIDREAKEDAYREHVENFCFEYPEKFRILYQKAPDLLHYRDLSLTLDYEVDYIKLKRFYELIKNIPYKKQPHELICKINKCRTGIIFQGEVHFGKIVEVLNDKCQCIPSLFFYSESVIQEQRKITVSIGSTYSDIIVRTDNNLPRLLDLIKAEEFDFFFSSFKLPDNHKITASKGAVFVDTVEVANKKRYCLRYIKAEDEKLNHISDAPIFIDFQTNISHETKDDFLLRVLPLTINQLIAGPFRPADKQEAFYPPEEKLGRGTRRGFHNPMTVNFPSVILIEMIEKVRYKNKTKKLYLDSFLQDKLIDEISKYPFEKIMLGVLNDPRSHPDSKSLIEKLYVSVGKEKTSIWLKKKLIKCLEPDDSLFQQIILSTNGTLRYSLHDNSGETIVGDFYKTSIAEVWQSKKMQQVRVDALNAIACQ